MVIVCAAVDRVVLELPAGDSDPRVPGAQALLPAVPLRAAPGRAHSARAQHGLAEDEEAARARAKAE